MAWNGGYHSSLRPRDFRKNFFFHQYMFTTFLFWPGTVWGWELGRRHQCFPRNCSVTKWKSSKLLQTAFFISLSVSRCGSMNGSMNGSILKWIVFTRWSKFKNQSSKLFSFRNRGSCHRALSSKSESKAARKPPPCCLPSPLWCNFVASAVQYTLSGEKACCAWPTKRMLNCGLPPVCSVPCHQFPPPEKLSKIHHDFSIKPNFARLNNHRVVLLTFPPIT